MDVLEEEDEDVLEPDYNPSLSYWGAYLMIYRPSKLSDEHMQWHFGDRDGKWSRQTNVAIARSGAKGLDLNDNWALAGQGWLCPSCGRTKDQCFRLSKRGILLAKLELHHDHMRDLVWPRAGELLGHDWRDRIPGTGEMLGLVRDLVSRFSEALVCSECNAADAKAKKVVPGMDDRFTFTVSEIRSFAIARPGQDHGIDVGIARAIWESQRGGFEMRLRLLDTPIGEIGTGRLVHDKEGWPGVIPMQLAMDGQELLWRAFLDQIRRDERRAELSGLRTEFLRRSVSLDSRRLADRTVRLSSGPTDEDYAAYCDPVSPKTWTATGDDWTCACCGRRKREIVRKGNKGRWSGGLRKLRIMVEETDADAIERRMRLFPGYRNEFWVGDSYFVGVCSDCADVRRDARQRDRSAPDSHLKIEDIRDALLEVRASAAHVADEELVCQRLRDNLPYDSAYEAYSAFRSLVSTLRSRVDFRMSRGVLREAVNAELCEDLKYGHDIESAEEQLELVEWLLARKVRDPREEWWPSRSPSRPKKVDVALSRSPIRRSTAPSFPISETLKT